MFNSNRLLLAACTSFFSLILSAAVLRAAPPNIVFIMADDSWVYRFGLLRQPIL